MENNPEHNDMGQADPADNGETVDAKAHLRRRLLLALYSSNAESVTVLADGLRANRSSVSRALHALQDSGFAADGVAGWHLTPKGEREALRLSYTVSGQLRDTLDRINSLAAQGLSIQSSMPDFTKTLGSAAFNAAGGISAMADATERMKAIIDVTGATARLDTLANSGFKAATEVVNGMTAAVAGAAGIQGIAAATNAVAKAGNLAAGNALIGATLSTPAADALWSAALATPAFDAISKAALTPAISPEVIKSMSGLNAAAKAVETSLGKYPAIVAAANAQRVAESITEKVQGLTRPTIEKVRELTPTPSVESVQGSTLSLVTTSAPGQPRGSFVRIGSKRVNLDKVTYYDTPEDGRVDVYFDGGSVLTFEGDDAMLALSILED